MGGAYLVLRRDKGPGAEPAHDRRRYYAAFLVLAKLTREGEESSVRGAKNATVGGGGQLEMGDNSTRRKG